MLGLVFGAADFFHQLYSYLSAALDGEKLVGRRQNPVFSAENAVDGAAIKNPEESIFSPKKYCVAIAGSYTIAPYSVTETENRPGQISTFA
jgi:hypothetical protein